MREQGATLIEVLLALVLTALGLVAAAPMFVVAARETAVGADLGAVGARAVDRMELLRRGDFYALGTGGSLTADVSGFSDTADPAVTVRWQIVAVGSPPRRKAITVRALTTRQVLGQAKEVSLTTLRAR